MGLSLEQINAQSTNGKGFTPNGDNKNKRDRQPQTDQYTALATTADADTQSMGTAIATTNNRTAQGLQEFVERDDALTEAVAVEVAGRLRTRSQRIARRVVELMTAPSEVEFDNLFNLTSFGDPIDMPQKQLGGH